MTKKRIFSGVQPSGNLHIGNYLGAISKWVEMQDEYESIFCVVDYHAITVPQDPELLRKRIIEIAKIYIASGIDPKKSVIFQQSAIKEHTELGWVLNTISRMSDLFRMTQFKDKAGLTEDEVGMDKLNKSGVGLFDYPVLQAADITLYDTDAVPVGKDQVQHIELTRTLARRFNKKFGNVLKVPEVVVRKAGANIMALDEPTKKMSKSAKSEYNYIALTEDLKTARKKIMKAVTDTDSVVKYDLEKKPGISNLLTIYSILSKIDIKTLEKKYTGKGYGDFKKDLADVVCEFLEDFQKKYNEINDADVRKILDAGAKKIQPIATETMDRVKKAMGII